MPSMSIPRAITQVCSPKYTPSTISATRSSEDRSVAGRCGPGREDWGVAGDVVVLMWPTAVVVGGVLGGTVSR
jgi:hypothetical protein